MLQDQPGGTKMPKIESPFEIWNRTITSGIVSEDLSGALGMIIAQREFERKHHILLDEPLLPPELRTAEVNPFGEPE
jgi:hypothetical protein